MAGPEEAVRDWLRMVIGVGGDPVLSALVPLGGFSADAHRMDMTCDGRTWSFVLKRPRPWSAEAAVLRLLETVRLPAGRVPTLIAEGTDAGGSWMVASFEPGDHPGVAPDVVFDTLARIHAHQYDPESLGVVPVLDLAWWTQLCDWVSQAVERSVPEAERPDLLEASRRWAADAGSRKLSMCSRRRSFTVTSTP